MRPAELTRRLRALLAGSVLAVAAPFAAAQAYETRAPIYASWSPGDGVAFTLDRVTARNPLIYASPVANGQRFEIRMIDRSVALLRTHGGLPGLKPGLLRFDSLDVLHDEHLARPTDQPYRVRVFMTRDFLWIEMRKADAIISPVASTVFFIGGADDVLAFVQPGWGYFDYDLLRKDVQANYADRYDPNHPGTIQYPRAGIAAAAMMASPR